MSVDARAAAVRMDRVTKAFGPVQVLKGVSFELRPGEIHALLGGNGAGKSTLMKILTGVYTPDGGQITVAGRPVRFDSARDSAAAGIAMIFQELSLVPALTVAQNVCLNREPRTRTGLLDDRRCAEIARETLHQMQVDIDPQRPVALLSTSQRQVVEVAKALSQGARVVIMDEPTASLASAEVHALFELCRRLKAQGIGVVYVSHRMEEVFEISDRFTVLRDGVNVFTGDTADATLAGVVAHIVGPGAKQEFAWREHSVDRSQEPLLSVRGLSTDRLHDVSFDVFPGEVLGVAGLMGSGRSRLLRTLFGMEAVQAGEIRIGGRSTRFHSPTQAISAGVALIPEDRRTQGLVLQHAIRDNVLLPLLSRTGRWGFVDDREGDRVVQGLSDALSINTDSIYKPVGVLSGGNQQKVVIAKWLATGARLLLMDEPTVGVDVRVKAQILEMIRDLASRRMAVIVVSSELPELLAVSDRVLVLRGGRVFRVLDRRDIGGVEGVAGEAAFAAHEEALHRAMQGGLGAMHDVR